MRSFINYFEVKSISFSDCTCVTMCTYHMTYFFGHLISNPFLQNSALNFTKRNSCK